VSILQITRLNDCVFVSDILGLMVVKTEEISLQKLKIISIFEDFIAILLKIQVFLSMILCWVVTVH
jgi:hypothetical protein